jgi:hypothetical protein
MILSELISLADSTCGLPINAAIRLNGKKMINSLAKHRYSQASRKKK